MVCVLGMLTLKNEIPSFLWSLVMKDVVLSTPLEKEDEMSIVYGAVINEREGF